MTDRVVVFLDWQNVYRRARGAFFAETDPHVDGQVDPVLLAKRLAIKKPNRTLKGVRIYRGIPTPKQDATGYSANRRHTAAWMRQTPRPHVYLRPLQYLPGMAPREKGIDVQLAIDFTVMAVRGEFDVGILFSTDTDLAPALDAVFDLSGGGVRSVTAEVAAWSGAHAPGRRINCSGSRSVWCHWLAYADYAAVHDPTDYSHK